MKSRPEPDDRVRWLVESGVAAIARAGPVWDAVNKSGGRSNPMLSSVAVNHLIRQFGSGSLSLATLKCGDVVEALAVLDRAGSLRWRVFAPSQAPLPLVVARPGLTLAEHAAGLLREIGRCAVLLDVPRHDDDCVHLGAYDGNAVHGMEWGTTISIRNEGDFEGYWSARTKDLRSNIRRYIKRAEAEAGGMQFLAISEPAEISAAVARYGLLESDGWKGREGTSLHPDNVQGRFYADLLSELATLGCTRIYELHIGETIAASRLMAQSHDMLVALKTTYRESMRSFAPGRLVTYYMLKDVMSRPAPRLVEFFTRADADTLAWATDTRKLSDMTLYRNPAVRRFADMRRWIKEIGGKTRRKAAT